MWLDPLGPRKVLEYSKKFGLIINRTKDELEKKLDKISPKTLADRLKEQENADIIKRESFAVMPLIKWVSFRDAQ